MKYHGLVLFTSLGIAAGGWTQAAFAEDELPPAPSDKESTIVEPRPLPDTVIPEPTDDHINVNDAIRQFRNELSEFQAMREEIARSTRATMTEAERTTIQQRQELLDLLNQLARKNAARKSTPPTPPQLPSTIQLPPAADDAIEPRSEFEEAEPEAPATGTPAEATDSDTASQIEAVDPADAFALGKVLFRAGDFAGAEKAFRKAVVTAENELTLKYLLATCLRRQSQWKASADTYKQVVDSNQDPVLRDLAKWQLDNIRWHQQSEAQLQQLRKQRDKRPESNKSASGAVRTKR